MLLSLILLIALGVFAVSWLRFARVKELAVKQAKKYCNDQGVDLLDDTVTLSGVKLKRDADGRSCLQRSYLMNFYNPLTEVKASALIIMRGNDLFSIAGERPAKIIDIANFRKINKE